ncbi:hydrogenase formation protein HypD [Vallitalea sediminicola]
MNEKLLIAKMVQEINGSVDKDIVIMEVCGTHTQSIAKYGIWDMLSPNIKLVSGPGCPVCVTDKKYIDMAVSLSQKEDVIIATFGDLMKVTGTISCLSEEKSTGKDIRIIYSPIHSIQLAKEFPNKKVVFLAVGFETTAPLIGKIIMMAREQNISNLFFLTSLKLMKPILIEILNDKSNCIDGIICPGHVATIKGSTYFSFITNDYNIKSVVSGFEPLDIISGIYLIMQQCKGNVYGHNRNLYKRCVKEKGNHIANKILEEVFDHKDGNWRGIGMISNSAMIINNEYEDFDAEKNFYFNDLPEIKEDKCICRDILLGKKIPVSCKLFGNQCTPQHPVGACMVSSEGTCGIYYRYRKEG